MSPLVTLSAECIQPIRSENDQSAEKDRRTKMRDLQSSTVVITEEPHVTLIKLYEITLGPRSEIENTILGEIKEAPLAEHYKQCCRSRALIAITTYKYE